jgi:hypothetical protein
MRCGFWLPQRDLTFVDVRLYGKKVLTIDHHDYSLNSPVAITQVSETCFCLEQGRPVISATAHSARSQSKERDQQLNAHGKVKSSETE